jgi:amino acid transporter
LPDIQDLSLTFLSFYILSLLFIGLLVPYDEPRLLNGSSDASASPFVIAAFNAGLKGYDSFLNVVILVSVISIGNAGVYGGSRTLTALAEQGYAPGIFTYIDRSGRPLWSTVFILACGLLGYMNLAATGEEIFNWLLSLSGLAALFTWGSICVAHIRFRSAWKFHGHTVDEIPFQAVFGVYGSWVGLILIILVLIAQVSLLSLSLGKYTNCTQFYIAVWPVGGGVNDAYGFFLSYLAAPVVLAFWAGGYLWKRQGWLKTSQIDVDTGRRPVDWDAIKQYKAELAAKPFWRRALIAMF